MIEKINNEIFLAINAFAGQNFWIDGFAIIIAESLPVLFIGALIYLWFGSKKNGKEAALYAGYSATVGVSINLLITLLYFHPRPFMNGIGTALINHAAETSFPSDHTTFALSIATTLLLIESTRKLAILFVALGVAGGISRVFCGIHYPLDILGSLIVAIISSALIWSLKKKIVVVNEYIISKYVEIVGKKIATGFRERPNKEL